MQFAKMHGAGNDFIVLTAETAGTADYGDLARKLCHRRFGVGADGLLVACSSALADTRMAYYNSDGSLAEMCGNGIRCFSRFVWEKGLVQKQPFVVETAAGLKTIWIHGEGDQLRVRVGMGLPFLKASEVPAEVGSERVWEYTASACGQEWSLYSIRMGVPHTVIFCDAMDSNRTETVGPVIETYPIFPAKTNVNFVQVLSSEEINVDTWERGAGHTLACGTGVCASVWLAKERNLVGNKVAVQVPGGRLLIEITDSEVYMEGEARWICEGTFIE